MQGKVLGIPLSVIILWVSIVLPLGGGILWVDRHVRDVGESLRFVQEQNYAALNRPVLVPTVEPTATPSAVPTKTWTKPVITATPAN